LAFKVSYFFQWVGERTGGWSWNFWNSGTDLNPVQIATDALRNALNGITGNQTICPFARISDISTFRVVDLRNYVAGAIVPTPSDPANTDFPTNAALLELTAAGGYIARSWLRGLPDGIINTGGRFLPYPAWIALQGTAFGILTNAANGWSLRVLDKGQAPKVVQDITQAGVVTCLGHGYATNDVVRISRARNLVIANRLWRVTVTDANTFMLQGWVVPAVVTPYTGNGQVRKQVRILVQIANARFVRATEHRVGRPFGLLSGRRKRRPPQGPGAAVPV
jgi:hypothetical protein